MNNPIQFHLTADNYALIQEWLSTNSPQYRGEYFVIVRVNPSDDWIITTDTRIVAKMTNDRLESLINNYSQE